jgi:GAF domain-containing protein
MGYDLRDFTILINFLSAVITFWLGLYLVTRNPRNRIAWLTGVAMWLIGGLFLNILFALSPPTLPETRPLWLRLLLIFWAGPITQQGGNAWLTGWSIAFAISMWHHITTLIRGPLNWWRVVRISAGYIISLAAVILRIYTPYIYTSETGDPLYMNALKGGTLFPYFAASILFFAGWSFVNLIRTARRASSRFIRKQLETLTYATLVAGLAGPVAIAGSIFDQPVPIVFVALPLAVAVGMIGYGIARYSALVQGRTLGRDFFFSAFSLAVLLLAYLGGTWLMLQAYDLPSAAYMAIALIGILTHSLYSISRQLLERFVYTRYTTEIRAHLQQLGRLAAEQETFKETLAIALETICQSVNATYGILLLIKDQETSLLAGYQLNGSAAPLSAAAIAVDDATHLNPRHFPPPFEEAALLVPLYTINEQIGAILLGRPRNGLHYAEADLEELLHPADRIALALQQSRKGAESLEQITRMAQIKPPQAALAPEKIPVREVELALRNLKDYSYLADTPIGHLRRTRQYQPEHSVTHIDRGKAAAHLLMDTLDQLKPAGDKPGAVPAREWYPYLILYEAYVEEKLNRDIMARLYISEGTFNRTRRQALNSVARLLEEMEITS